MNGSATHGPLRYFLDLTDPRAPNVRHRLIDILLIALCACICDADGWDDFEDFAEAKAAWFGSFLDLKHGVPSADTFRRVLSALDPVHMERCFMNWMQSVVQTAGGKLLAIDGKSIRRSFDKGWDKSGMTHLVSLFAQQNGLVLGQLKTQGKGRELAGILELLGMVDLTNATVTVDAIGASQELCRTITDKGGDYLICLKGNQPALHAAVRRLLDEMILEQFKGVGDTGVVTDAGHGRIETRRVWVTDQIDSLPQSRTWPGLSSVAVVESTRDIDGQVSVERRYFISSLKHPDASNVARAIRGHWGIENGLHHVLDVSFHEDDSRVRKQNAAENLSRLRRMALNLLKDKGTRLHKRTSIKGRRKIAGWDHQFLLNLLAT